jgi:hypothetical protein
MTTTTCGQIIAMSTEPASRGGRRPRRWLVGFAVVLSLLATGCASGTHLGTGSTPTPRTSPTATVPPLTDVTPGADTLSACAGPTGARLGITQTRVGLYDSWQQLPSDLPLRPEPISIAKVVANIALNSVTVEMDLTTLPVAALGYVCAVSVRVAAFQPLAAPIPNVTRTCSDHAYLDPGGADYGGDCGVVTGPPATASVTIPTTTPGATVTVPIQNAEAPGKPAAFPRADGGASKVWIVLKVAASGTYTFTIGLWQAASAGPTLTTVVTDLFDLEAAHEWSGQDCTQPSMQAQLPPPTNPPTLVFCPGGPPLYQ